MCFPAQASAVIEPSFLFRSISSEISIVADVLADEERCLSLCGSGVGECDTESFLLLLEAMATAKKCGKVRTQMKPSTTVCMTLNVKSRWLHGVKTAASNLGITGSNLA